MAISLSRVEELKKFQREFQTNFQNLNLLNAALSHRSYVKEKAHLGQEDNERLEFLGDAVLKLVISDYFYKQYPLEDEGFLTKIRGAIISDATLAKIGHLNKLGKHLLLSRSENASGGPERKSILADSLEALFGACYLDQGLEAARRLILRLMQPAIAEAFESGQLQDFKSLLQEKVQALGWKLPEYRVIQEFGPEHDKTFRMEARVGKGMKKYRGQGNGHTKKEAEQSAAAALLKICAQEKVI